MAVFHGCFVSLTQRFAERCKGEIALDGKVLMLKMRMMIEALAYGGWRQVAFQAKGTPSKRGADVCFFQTKRPSATKYTGADRGSALICKAANDYGRNPHDSRFFAPLVSR